MIAAEISALTAAREVEALRAEVAELRGRLAELLADDAAARLQGALGLTASEAQLLAVLWRRSPGLVRKGTLWSALYADEIDGGPDLKIIDVFVCKLRAKAGELAGEIRTVWGQGYHLTALGANWLNARVEAAAA